MPTVADLAAALNAFAPPHTAADWDNVGLLLGDPAAPVGRVMTCLTVTPDVAAEAVGEKADLIVSHHPILFRGAKTLVAGKGDGDVVLPLARAGVAVYSPHTAFDNCPGGVNDVLCRRLGVRNAVPLRPREGPRQFKIAVYVPDADLAKVSDALFAAGAGVIGKYEQCSFRVPGKGTFFGTDDTNPVVGQKGRREDVDEWRLEVLVPEANVTAAVRAMRAAHSYEEVAFDIYQLRAGQSGGEGRVGELEAPATLGELAKRAKTELGAASVQVVGDSSRTVRKVGVACGAAGEFLVDSVRAGVDVFITGELRFHDALSARAAGVGVIVPGHYATERPAVEELAAKLAADHPGVTAWASRVERDPLGPG
ncbi:Nif3-like dinuclear metal center hexameric protein [Urbifossiella limnaea]|uniref:GTP cyclohydrolase 1 type 2 homolog n=1 Tax=Urbifossiella limnaea TaxID=2528023 RepID=A0A517XUQ5_9BACT|nr:Nif3-like dinuclear metal center hexameric protein [Urbifossiella limnaea]QDU21241.1 Putative GTP cyclohydrolase 1 type 2 [Urbifossiella limnaea]